MDDNLIDEGIDTISKSVFQETSNDIYLINPSKNVIGEFISVATSFDGTLPTQHVLADEYTLKDIRDDFIVTSNAVNLITEDNLEFRLLEEPPQNPLLITENRVITIIHVGDRVGGLVADDESFVEDTRDTYATRLEDSPVFNL